MMRIMDKVDSPRHFGDRTRTMRIPQGVILMTLLQYNKMCRKKLSIKKKYLE